MPSAKKCRSQRVNENGMTERSGARAQHIACTPTDRPPRLTHTLQRFVITSRRQQCVRTHPEGDESVASLGLIPSFRRAWGPSVSARAHALRAARARAAPAGARLTVSRGSIRSAARIACDPADSPKHDRF